MDLFVANIDQEIFSLYQNNHERDLRRHGAMRHGIGMATQLMSGWGLKFFDYDNDGNLDLILSNGHPDDLIDGRVRRASNTQEPMLLFRNTRKRFRQTSARRAARSFPSQLPARGLAIGDFDNDGAVDVLIAVNDGPPDSAAKPGSDRNHWLGVQLVGKKVEPGRRRRAHHLPGRRSETQPNESGRRQLSCPRTIPAWCWGLGDRTEDRLARSEMAAARRRGGALYRSSARSLHHHRRGEGKWK